MCIYRGSDSFQNISGLFGSYLGVSTPFNFPPLFFFQDVINFSHGTDIISYPILVIEFRNSSLTYFVTF